MTGDVQLRRAEPGDAAAIVALYERLGDGSRHQRFAQATPRLCSTIRRALTDFSAGPVWVAIRERQVIGEARLVRSTGTGASTWP